MARVVLRVSRRAPQVPPPFLDLAGHPVRWRLLQELVGSDRQVGELTELVGRAPEPRLVPPGPPPTRGPGEHPGQRRGRSARLLPRRSPPVRGAPRRRRRRVAPGARAVRGRRAPARSLGGSPHRRRPPDPPRAHRGDPPRPAAAVPLHREQRPVADGRGAGGRPLVGGRRGGSAGSHPRPSIRTPSRSWLGGASTSRGRAPSTCGRSAGALRPRRHALRQGARGLSRVPGPTPARPLEHSRSGPRGR